MLRSKKLKDDAFQDVTPQVSTTIGKNFASVYSALVAANTSATVTNTVGYGPLTIGTNTGGSTITIPSYVFGPGTVQGTIGVQGVHRANNSKPDLSEEDRLQKIKDIAGSIENLIADYMPEAHKDLPVEVAFRVVESIFDSLIEAAPGILDPDTYKRAESRVAANIANMTMEEYAKARNSLLGYNIASVPPMSGD